MSEFNFDLEPLRKIEGTVKRIKFHAPDTGYTICDVETKDGLMQTVILYSVEIMDGFRIEGYGNYQKNPKFGWQFVCKKSSILPPSSTKGILAYLSSGMVKSVGKKYARLLVDAFGDQVFNVIDNEPDRLYEVKGIGQKRVKKILTNWNEQKEVRKIVVFFEEHGISVNKAIRIYKTYGNAAIEIITQNPYRLVKDILGIGFRTADAMAISLGIPHDSPLRISAGIFYTLETASQKGHCYLSEHDLIKETGKILGLSASEENADIVKTIIGDEVLAGNLSRAEGETSDCIYLPWLFIAEKKTAYHVKRLTHGKLPWDIENVDEEISDVQEELGITLATSQVEAVKTALQSKFMVITGGPGVGKTTIVKSIFSIVKNQDVRVNLCAPTGRAAKRLSESSGHSAYTIHRLLEFNPKTEEFERNEDNPLSCDLLVIDESSMIDISLAYKLLRAVPGHSAVIFVGDVDQLPSVGAGSVLKDLINSEVVPVIRLTEVFRQAASSWIIKVANQINRGEKVVFPTAADDGDCYFVPVENEAELQEELTEIVCDRLPAKYDYDPKTDIQVLTPMRKGSVGVTELNKVLQSELNRNASDSVSRFGNVYGIGDKVMQIVNNYDKNVFNGDIGFVIDIDNVDEKLTVRFDDVGVVYDFAELDELVLAYACTIHKSQGSEYPVVVLPVTKSHYIMLCRNLFYTGVTRGKKLVVLVGQYSALMTAVNNKHVEVRNTMLRERVIQEFLPKPQLNLLEAT